MMNETLVFIHEGQFTSGSVESLVLPLEVVPFSAREWNIVVYSSCETKTSTEIIDYFTPTEALELTFFQENEAKTFESFHISEGQIRPFYRSLALSFEESFRNALDIAVNAFPAKKTLLFVLEDAHGWRTDIRDEYPENVFYDRTTSILEFDALLASKTMDLLISMGSYGGLIENLYQVADHFRLAVSFEGRSPSQLSGIGALLASLSGSLDISVEDFANDAYAFFCSALQSLEPQLIEEESGMGCSVVEMSSLPVLADSLVNVFDQLTLVLTDMEFKEALKKDLGFTLDWNTLAFQYPDYKDLDSWLTILKTSLNGQLYSQNYRVKSREDGYSYDILKPMVVQLLQLIDNSLEYLDQAVLSCSAYGYKEDLQENGRKLGKTNNQQMKGIGFWYPIAVRGGLWNVYGKEKYDRLRFSEETEWTVFLNRLLSVDQLPAKQILMVDEFGTPVRGIYSPGKELYFSGGTVNIGFLDREAIDKVWVLFGDDYLTDQTLTDKGGSFIEDESSFRCFIPVGTADAGKRIGARVLLKGKEDPVDFDFGSILPLVKGKNLYVTDANGNGLLGVPVGNEVYISPFHYLIVEAEVEESVYQSSYRSFITFEGNSGSIEYPMEEVYRYNGRVLLRSEPISAENALPSNEIKTWVSITSSDTSCETVNRYSAENWIIHIVQ
jgi:hypothetical protein